jgi:hypothetical protein
MIEIVKIIAVERLGGFRLRLGFSDGTEGEKDFSDVIAGRGPMVAPLKDPAFFSRVFLELGVLTWPNGFDLDTIALHEDMAAAGLLHRASAQLPAN